MLHWHAFEEDRDYVLEQFYAGVFDHLEVAGRVAESEFFRHFLDRGDLDALAASYPTPRQKEEVPLWLYLSSELTLKLHGAHGFGAYPYVLHCGGLREALGPDQSRWREDPGTGARHQVYEGYNQKNDYERVTPCDHDFLRKLARDTEVTKLQDWFDTAVPRFLAERSAFDEQGIFLIDGSYLFVPDNPHYAGSDVLRFDEHNHPISQAEEDALPKAAKRRCHWERCYKAVTLLHTNLQQDLFLYGGARILPGRASEVPYLKDLPAAFAKAVGRGVLKILIHDRGFIDGAATGLLKQEHGIDSVFPLKSGMTIYDEARRLSEVDETPWQTFTPTPKAPPPVPPQRPESIRRREQKRMATRQLRGIGRKQQAVRVLNVELKAVRDHRTWDSCPVPVHVVLLREYRSDGKCLEWALATTKDFTDPLEIWQLYQVRTAIEERHRQLKCFWDLTSFRSPAFSLVVNQVVFVLLAYTLVQLFLKDTNQGLVAGKVRERLLQMLMPEEDLLYLYCDGRFATFTGLELMGHALDLDEGPRRRMRGVIRQLRQARFRPPDLPSRQGPFA